MMAMENKINVDVRSEIGELEGVIIHTPGKEVENMTPQNAERALYSDILNLSVANEEYEQFSKVLQKLTNTFQVKDLLTETLSNQAAKRMILDDICINEDAEQIKEYLKSIEPAELATLLIEGVPIVKDSLTKFVSGERYSLQPLHNFFFTRDASVAVRGNVLVCRLSSRVREREAIIMEHIFNHHHQFQTTTINPLKLPRFDPKISIEGGDLLVASDNVMLVGMGSRTTTQGIDFILQQLQQREEERHIIVQELPEKPESFIHLDMVFTFLDKDKCMVYEPVIFNQHNYQTIHIKVDNGKVKISEKKNIPEALKKLGFDLEPIYCGGNNDGWIQEREQWHSGANFFSVAPGKVLGYGRNKYTIEELNKHGFEVLDAYDINDGKVDVNNYSKYVITIEGSELSRGGGGCRCMTMPIRRKQVNW